jgi:UDP-glucose 4-epimerase
MKKALVTGANGFIGRHVCRYLSEQGYHVIGIGHGFWTDDEWRAWGLSEWFELDVTLASLVAHGGQPDVIYHCAGSGSVGFSVENPAQDFDRSVVTTIEVLEYIRTLSSKTVLIFPSSGAVYGKAEKFPINEKDPLHPTSPYGYHKKMAEDLLISYGRTYGIRCGVVRLFSVYGTELKKQLLWDSCNKFMTRKKEFFGTGDETRDWISVKDVVRLMYVLAENASSEVPIVNGGTGESVKIADIIGFLGSQFPESSSAVFNGKTRAGDPEHTLADTTSARAIGWKPEVSWQEGMKEYAQWFRSLH